MPLRYLVIWTSTLMLPFSSTPHIFWIPAHFLTNYALLLCNLLSEEKQSPVLKSFGVASVSSQWLPSPSRRLLYMACSFASSEWVASASAPEKDEQVMNGSNRLTVLLLHQLYCCPKAYPTLKSLRFFCSHLCSLLTGLSNITWLPWERKHDPVLLLQGITLQSLGFSYPLREPFSGS